MPDAPRDWQLETDDALRAAAADLSKFESQAERAAILNEAHRREWERGGADAPPPREAPPDVPTAPGPYALTPGRGFLVMVAFTGGQIAVGAAAGLAIGMGALATGAGEDSGALVDSYLSAIVLLATGIAGAALWTWVQAVRRGPGGEAFQAAIGWKRATAPSIALGALLGIAIAITTGVAITAWMPPPEDLMNQTIQMARLEGWRQGAWLVTVVLLAPFFEELVFRGVLYGAVAPAWGVPGACVAISAVFVSLHAAEFYQYWPMAIGLLLLALGTFAARRYTGSILPAVAVHFAYNATVCGAAFLAERGAG